MKLIDVAKILRSKNAGPLFITFDIIFHNTNDMKKVYNSLKKEDIATVYGAKAEQIKIIAYEIVNSIKITLPRKHISGSIYDNDIYGCQQHMPLANMEIQGEWL